MWDSIKRIIKFYVGVATVAFFMMSWAFPVLILTDIRSGGLGARAAEGRTIAIFVSAIAFVMGILGVVVQTRIRSSAIE